MIATVTNGNRSVGLSSCNGMTMAIARYRSTAKAPRRVICARAVRRRLDAELVRRGLTASRQRALEEIGAGRVLVGGLPARSVARRVAAEEPISISGEGPRFVSRGGEKLAAAIDHFDVDVTDRRALDAGASTGGFTDCLLQPERRTSWRWTSAAVSWRGRCGRIRA